MMLNDLLTKLDYNWFNEKVKAFRNEGLYDSQLGRIHDSFMETDYVQTGEDYWEEQDRRIMVDVDLKGYCWSSVFYGSDAGHHYDHDSGYLESLYPIDSRDIADDIISLIHKATEKFIDVEAIDIFIKNIVADAGTIISGLQSSSTDDGYKDVLSDFLLRLRQQLSKEFKHIKHQVNLKKSQTGIDKKLTHELCSRLANFKLNNKRFVTSIEGPLGEGEALLYLLSATADPVPGVKIRIEDWTNNDVYYLLTRLSEIITDRFSIASIDRKKALFLKTRKLFSRSTFDTFKSQKLDNYIASNPNKSSIDNFLATLFR